MGTTDANGVYTPARDEEDWDPEIAGNFVLFSQAITDLADHGIAADPHPGYQRESQRAVASGYASLDSGTKVPIAQLPTGTSSTTVALGNAAAGLDSAHVAASDPHPVYLNEGADISLTADISPTAISATEDDYDPTGLSTANTLRLATNNTTQRNISGLAGGADGRVLLVHNVGPGPVAFIDQGAGSTATNRFALAGDMILLPDSSCFLQYDATSSRWRMLARATAATNPALTFGTTNVGGTSPYFVRSDDQLLLFDATAPAAIGAAAVGTAGTAPHRDHVHATGAGTPSTQASGDSAATGSGPAAAMTDHKHAFPNLITQTTFAKQGPVGVSTGTLRWYNDSGRTLTFVSTRASVGTAPTGAALTVDVNVDGTTIFTTQGSRPSIAISGTTDQGDAPDVTTIAASSYLTVDVDQVGSTVAGSDLTVQVFLKG